MSCFIQSNLAKVLAEFEIALEREVLQPLNKLSEVALASLLHSLSYLCVSTLSHSFHLPCLLILSGTALPLPPCFM